METCNVCVRTAVGTRVGMGRSKGRLTLALLHPEIGNVCASPLANGQAALQRKALSEAGPAGLDLLQTAITRLNLLSAVSLTWFFTLRWRQCFPSQSGSWLRTPHKLSQTVPRPGSWRRQAMCRGSHPKKQVKSSEPWSIPRRMVRHNKKALL